MKLIKSRKEYEKKSPINSNSVLTIDKQNGTGTNFTPTVINQRRDDDNKTHWGHRNRVGQKKKNSMKQNCAHR